MSRTTVSVRVRGIKKPMQTFIRLMGAQMAEKVMMNAMVRAVKPTVLAAKDNVPVGDPRTARSVGGKKSADYRGDPRHLRDVIRAFRLPATFDKGYRVSVSYPKAWYYGHMVEFGSVRHHPVAFLRRAFDETAEGYIESVVEEVRTGFKKSVERAQRMKDPFAGTGK